MLKIAKKQMELLKKYLPQIEEYIEEDNKDELLSELDFAITDHGFNDDYSLNSIGRELQRTYDIIYREN